MSDVTYSKEDIQDVVRRLTYMEQVCFGVSCCERLLPNYVAFRNETGWGDPLPLQNAINMLWKHLGGEPLGANDAQVLARACEVVAPDSEDFESLLTSAAQDAVFAICSVLDFISTHDSERIAQASAYSIDTVDMYVQEKEGMQPNNPGLEEQIRTHPLMQKEINRQESDMAILQGVWNLADVEKKWRSPKVSNINE